MRALELCFLEVTHRVVLLADLPTVLAEVGTRFVLAWRASQARLRTHCHSQPLFTQEVQHGQGLPEILFFFLFHFVLSFGLFVLRNLLPFSFLTFTHSYVTPSMAPRFTLGKAKLEATVPKRWKLKEVVQVIKRNFCIWNCHPLHFLL